MTRGERAVTTLVLTLVVPALAPWAALAQAQLGSSLSPEESAFLDAHGPIRYVFNDGFAPFTLVDDHGAVRGINRDMLRLMAVHLGVEFTTVQSGNFSQTLQAISNGSADVAGNLGSTPERAATMSFTEPYAYLRIVPWVKEGHHLPADMVGARVAIVRNTAILATAQKAWPQAQVVLVDDALPGLDAVRNGTADAFLGGDAPTAYLVQQSHYFDLVVGGPPLEERAFSFAVPKNETLVLTILQRGLASISREDRAAIFIKWTGRDLNVALPPQPAVSLRALGLAGLVLLVTGIAIGVPAWIVTLRRRVDAKTREVRRLNARLETRVEERTRELDRANRELAAFTYTVSHDLRAPLRAMDGFSQALLEDANDQMDTNARAHVVRVRAAAQRMGSLIEDLLDLSRISRDELELADVDVTALAEEIEKGLRASAPPRRNVTFRVSPGLRARADPGLLRAVLQNLLDNAWKFTSTRDAPTIEVGRTSTPHGDAFFVRDDGVGFDARFVDKLFTPFQRLHHAADFPGNGIGLATVRRIVERHGGKAWAQSDVGKGATFYFTIPQPTRPNDLPKMVLP